MFYSSSNLRNTKNFKAKTICAYCDKNVYLSYDEANNVAKYRSQQGNVLLRVYKCPYGKGYHLTHKMR